MTIHELQQKYNLTKNDFWELQTKRGTWIITHDACEKIAHIEKIIFYKPEIMYNMNGVALLGEAEKDGNKIWSVGEASPDNVKIAGKYFWSMAEKRLKDRLTLKIINAYEFGVYSEAEAEEFKKPNQ